MNISSLLTKISIIFLIVVLKWRFNVPCVGIHGKIRMIEKSSCWFSFTYHSLAAIISVWIKSQHRIRINEIFSRCRRIWSVIFKELCRIHIILNHLFITFQCLFKLCLFLRYGEQMLKVKSGLSNIFIEILSLSSIFIESLLFSSSNDTSNLSIVIPIHSGNFLCGSKGMGKQRSIAHQIQNLTDIVIFDKVGRCRHNQMQNIYIVNDFYATTLKIQKYSQIFQTIIFIVLIINCLMIVIQNQIFRFVIFLSHILNLMSKEIDEHILSLYQPKKLLGSGAYGHVWKVIDRTTKRQYAMKKIFDAFQNAVDAQRTYRQITILHQLDHHNIIKLRHALRASNHRDLYLVFQFMQADLHSLVGQDVLSVQHLKFIIFQLLRALKYLHSAQLIHRDLKPSNVLINSNCQIKLCDFGLVRSLTCQENQQMILSEEVATRWYRSPQILLGSKKYSKATDVWSVGCIIGQLIVGKPIFPGKSTLNQLQLLVEFCGVPCKASIDSLHSQVADNLINQLSVRKKSMKDYFPPHCDPQIYNLVLRMLEFNPNKRITVEQALNLPLLKSFVDSEPQIICTKIILPAVDDNIRLDVESYRKIIYKDIERRYPFFNELIQMQINDSFEERKQRIRKLREKRSHQSLQKNQKIDPNSECKSITNSLHKSNPKYQKQSKDSKENSFSQKQITKKQQTMKHQSYYQNANSFSSSDAIKKSSGFYGKGYLYCNTISKNSNNIYKKSIIQKSKGLPQVNKKPLNKSTVLKNYRSDAFLQKMLRK